LGTPIILCNFLLQTLSNYYLVPIQRIVLARNQPVTAGTFTALNLNIQDVMSRTL